MQPTPPISVREQALELIKSLPIDATWDELLHRIYVRWAIERGMEDSSADRVVPADELHRQFELSPDERPIPGEDEIALLDARFKEMDAGAVQSVSREEAQRQLRKRLSRYM
jgi:hypothetical protein